MDTKPDELQYETLQSNRWNGLYPGQSPLGPPYYQHRTEKYGFSEASALYCAVMQIVFGLCFIAVGLGCFFLNTCMSIICLGIWGGVFFIIAGFLGISTVYKGGRKCVIATIVFCFFSCMIAAAAIVFGGIAIVLDFADTDSTILCPRIMPTSPKAVRGKIAMDILYVVFAGCETLITIIQALNCYSRNVTLHRMGCPHCKHCHALKVLLEKKHNQKALTRNITVPKSRGNVYVVPEPSNPEIIRATRAPTPVQSMPTPIHVEDQKDVRSGPVQQGKGQLVLDEKTIDTLKKNKQQVLVLPIIVPMQKEGKTPQTGHPKQFVYQDETLRPRSVSPTSHSQEPRFKQHSQEHPYQNSPRTLTPTSENVPVFWGQPITLDKPLDPDKPFNADTLPLDKMIQAEQQKAYLESQRGTTSPPPVSSKPAYKKQVPSKRRDTPYWGSKSAHDSEVEDQEQTMDLTDVRSNDSFNFDARL